MSKLCFEFCSDSIGMLKDMQAIYELHDEACVIKKALALLKTLTDLTNRGELVYKANEQETKVVIYPTSQKSMLKVIK